MRKYHSVLLASVALICASAASAAPGLQWHTTTVALPDGSQAEIQYVGDIPPRVSIAQPVVQDTSASIEDTRGEEVAYGGIPRARRIVQRPSAEAPGMAPAPQEPAPPQFIVSGDAPKGSTYEYSLITTGADGRVCTERTEWTARGKGKQPQIKKTNSGEGCAALSAQPGPAPVPQPAPRIQPVDPDAI